MIKIKKTFFFISLFFSVIIFSGWAYASEKSKSAKTDLKQNGGIKLVNFEVPTSFSSNKIKTEIKIGEDIWKFLIG